jgi:hypothetical protein
MKQMIFVFSVLFAVVSCKTDSGTAMSAIRDQGFTDVSLGDHDLIGWGCPEEADTNVTFTATQPNNGRRVRGIVCCDYWGSCTVRTRN